MPKLASQSQSLHYSWELAGVSVLESMNQRRLKRRAWELTCAFLLHDFCFTHAHWRDPPFSALVVDSFPKTSEIAEVSQEPQPAEE